MVQAVLRMPSLVAEAIVVDNDPTIDTAAVARRFGTDVIHEEVRRHGQPCKTVLLQAWRDITVTLGGDSLLVLKVDSHFSRPDGRTVKSSWRPRL